MPTPHHHSLGCRHARLEAKLHNLWRDFYSSRQIPNSVVWLLLAFSHNSQQRDSKHLHRTTCCFHVRLKAKPHNPWQDFCSSRQIPNDTARLLLAFSHNSQQRDSLTSTPVVFMSNSKQGLTACGMIPTAAVVKSLMLLFICC